MALVALVLLLVGVRPDIALDLFPSLGEPSRRVFLIHGHVNWYLTGFGIALLLPPAVQLVRARRHRIPRSLVADSDDRRR
jgi:hypothetical protein